jgi:hypothetical protein
MVSLWLIEPMKDTPDWWKMDNLQTYMSVCPTSALWQYYRFFQNWESKECPPTYTVCSKQIFVIKHLERLVPDHSMNAKESFSSCIEKGMWHVLLTLSASCARDLTLMGWRYWGHMHPLHLTQTLASLSWSSRWEVNLVPWAAAAGLTNFIASILHLKVCILHVESCLRVNVLFPAPQWGSPCKR